MGINQIYGTCTDLYDDDITLRHAAGVPDGGERSEKRIFESGKPNKRYRIDLAFVF
jgi:hypothetical protein